ncbi:NTF2-related export protein 2 [Balamuthia mandrillaris]
MQNNQRQGMQINGEEGTGPHQEREADTFIDDTGRAGESFIRDYYYNVYDTTRHLLHRFYNDTSTLLWNGTVKKGAHNLSEFFKLLPPSKHTVHSIDCQPVLENAEGPTGKTILVTTSGVVVYATDAPRCFSQSFVLCQDPSKGGKSFFILSDCFRLTSSPLPHPA